MTDEPERFPEPSQCPDPELIAAHAERRLVGEEAARLDEHIGSCATCHEVFAETIRFALDESGATRAFGRTGTHKGRVRAFTSRPAVRLAATLAAAAVLVLAFCPRHTSFRPPQPDVRVAERPKEQTLGPSQVAEGGSGVAEAEELASPFPREVHRPEALAPSPTAVGATAGAATVGESGEPRPRPEVTQGEETGPEETAVAPTASTPPVGRAAAGVGHEQEDELVRLEEEVTVVSASRLEQKLVDAPATMSVITGQTLETGPAQNMADVLRSVPGANVIRTSARDFNLTTRQATSTLANSTLVTVDGRSVYLDFLDFVMWDFVPSPSSGEIEQIEVVRGPASVVWGANAANGVVNFITKRPRVHEGFGLVVGSGLFGREGGSREANGSGHLFNGGLSFADAPSDTWSYKLSAGYYHSDPYSRPVATIQPDCHPLGESPCRDASGGAVVGGYPIGGATYPADADVPGGFENDGTSQPNFYLRVDQDLSNGGRVTYEGGFGGTQGIIHTGIGPFDLQSGSHMGFGRVAYNKGVLRVSAFANLLDAEAPNLLALDPDTLGPITLAFKTQTYDLDFGNSNVLGDRHIVTYGGNYRRNNFDITLAQGPDRNEFGGYAQWEYFIDRFRLAAGVRADKFASLEGWAWSPRVSVMFKPTADQSIRASYNRAFVAPSFINNHLDQNIQSPGPVDLTPLAAVLPPPLQPLIPPPFLLTVNAFGNPDLRQQSTNSYEIAYTASFGRTTVGLAGYVSNTDDSIHFTYLYPPGRPGYPQPTYYDVDSPARGVTLPTSSTPATPITLSPVVMGLLAQVPPELGGPIMLPEKAATYLNLGPIRNRGIEASIEHRLNANLSFFANYSWQDTPEILDTNQIPYPVNEVGIPPQHRFNAGLGYDGLLIFANANVNYASSALWVDVLSSDYAGFTDGHTMLNATLGVKLAGGRVMVSLKGTNLANQKIQQHIFGDLLRRSITAEVRFFAR